MWSQAVIVEVYTLSVLSLMGVLCCLYRWTQDTARMRYLSGRIASHFGRDADARGLHGLSILDIGCGGGLVSEPLCRLGATVTYANARGEEKTITIKGIDESDSLAGEVSWISPIARALLKAREGDEVQLMTPGGLERLEVLEVRYPAPGEPQDAA